MTSADYFIITNPSIPDTSGRYPGHIRAGCLCYASKPGYRSEVKRCGAPSKWSVIPFGSHTARAYEIDLVHMEVLSAEEAEMLLALPEDSERLKWLREGAALKAALGLTEGTPVTVEEGGEELRGIIRYIGTMTIMRKRDPLTAKFFGIELQVS